MRYKKQYGVSKITTCPFCNKQALTQSNQGIPVCLAHKKSELLNLKCLCSDWLDLQQGKHGCYFNCFKCGNISFKKALEVNEGNDIFFHNQEPEEDNPSKKKSKTSFSKKRSFSKKKKFTAQDKKETFVRSDEVDFLYL